MRKTLRKNNNEREVYALILGKLEKKIVFKALMS